MISFIYIKGRNTYIRGQMSIWEIKIREYITSIYNDELERILGTNFGDCTAKVRYLIDSVTMEPELFRGVQDINGRLHSAAVVEEYFDCLYIDTLVNAPWNVIKNQPETVKGAATSLIEGVVRESIELGYNGRLRAISIERAKSFYRRIGFVEDEDGSGGMELTAASAERFLSEQQIRKQSSND